MLWLPTEVLSQILQHAPRNSKNHTGVVVARESPLFLAHVCSHWRSIAFSIPDIWSFIDVTLRMTTTSHIHNRTKLFQLHLSLSRGASLSIALVSEHDDPDIIQPFIRTLLSHFPRCQSLYMELPESWFFKFPLEQLVTPQSFPNLRAITFHGDSVAYQWHNFRALTKTPALSSATILGFRYYYWSRISPPSPPLTHLNVSLPPECIYEVLRETSNVIECRIFCFDTEPSDDDYFNNSLPLLTLPHLSSLYIAGSSDGKTLLNLIQTPALQSFSCLLRFSFYPGTANLFDFLVGTPTTKLTTSECLLPAVHDFDSKSKNLRELRIEDWSEPVDAVLEDDGLRSLETLIIRLDKDPNLQFHDDLLLNLIASRMGTSSLVLT